MEPSLANEVKHMNILKKDAFSFRHYLGIK